MINSETTVRDVGTVGDAKFNETLTNSRSTIAAAATSR